MSYLDSKYRLCYLFWQNLKMSPGELFPFKRRHPVCTPKVVGTIYMCVVTALKDKWCDFAVPLQEGKGIQSSWGLSEGYGTMGIQKRAVTEKAAGHCNTPEENQTSTTTSYK